MTHDERNLLKVYRALDETDRRALAAFAEFLAARSAPQKQPLPPPEAIERPERETVIAALKRLSATYPMLDRAKLLNETSVLVSQHVIHGRDATQVIDDLEAVFRRHYERASAPGDSAE